MAAVFEVSSGNSPTGDPATAQLYDTEWHNDLDAWRMLSFGVAVEEVLHCKRSEVARKARQVNVGNLNGWNYLLAGGNCCCRYVLLVGG